MSKKEILCNVCFASTIITSLLLIYLFFKLNENNYSLDPYELIKLYDLDDDDTLASNTQVRQSDGKTCGITSIFEKNILKTTESGDCLGEKERIIDLN
jgi:hypothetical protein|tara:strand:+ start:2356 stop:2649 length:294 start_codon:yes stop_codon:yes gene_type:complete